MYCVVCDFKLESYGYSGKNEIKVCPICGLGETVNYKAPNINAYHRDETYFKEENQFANIFEKRVDLVCQIVKSGKVLEIGSSTGTLLKIFQERGFDVFGVEPSLKAAKVAQSQNIKTLTDTFEKINLPKDSFDVVIMSHTLEHVDDPILVVKKIQSILKVGGLLLIDVPNFGSFSSRLYKLSWKYLLPNEHKWHFTKKSLCLLLKNSGFTVEKTYSISGIWQYSSPIKELIASLIKFKKRFFINLITALPSYVITKLNEGTGLIVIAKKS